MNETASQSAASSGPPLPSASPARGRGAVQSAIREAQRVAVSSHTRPDGDAIGSMLACGMMLSQLGKQVEVVSSDQVPLLYRWLPCVEEIRTAQSIDPDCDLVILLECDGLERSGLQGLDTFLAAGRLVNIDHHASGREFAPVNWIEPAASAVAELIFDLCLAANTRVTPEMATCLYTALLTDTGSFCYQGTDAHTLRLAADLVRLGAQPAVVAQQVYFSNPLSKMVLLGTALSNLQREGRIAWLSVTQQDMMRAAATEQDCEGIVNYAIGIAGVEVAVFLRELPGEDVRLSLRSKGAVDVARIAQRFGGGGHANASGCTVPGPLPAAARQIIALLR